MAIYKPRWLLSIRYTHELVKPIYVIVNHYNGMYMEYYQYYQTYYMDLNQSFRNTFARLSSSVSTSIHNTPLTLNTFVRPFSIKKLTVVDKMLLKNRATGTYFTFQSDLNVFNTKRLTSSLQDKDKTTHRIFKRPWGRDISRHDYVDNLDGLLFLATYRNKWAVIFSCCRSDHMHVCKWPWQMN